MQGSLFAYAPGRQAFVTGSLQRKAAVLLGGLSDGLLACPYAPPLAKALEALGYATVQPVLRSSYAQFGFGSLDNDVEDLEALFACEAFGGVEEVFMVGHSTGSQICAHYARHGTSTKKLSVCLQGGVSDRETDSEQEVVHINKGAVAGRHGQGRRVPAARVPLVCCPASRHRRDSRVTYTGRP